MGKGCDCRVCTGELPDHPLTGPLRSCDICQVPYTVRENHTKGLMLAYVTGTPTAINWHASVHAKCLEANPDWKADESRILRTVSREVVRLEDARG